MKVFEMAGWNGLRKVTSSQALSKYKKMAVQESGIIFFNLKIYCGLKLWKMNPDSIFVKVDFE